ncbi:MAG: FliM/FliN family flagellar motor switch protein [Planctomycetes bacterium]|nr:FliM/FliN family flagellar motor switch protein [Planctomycetota bacterium]
MSSNVSPEEVDALLEGARAAALPRVARRDFTKPRRLSLSQQRAIRAALNKLTAKLEDVVSGWLQGPYGVEVAEIGETGAHGLFDGLEDPIVVRSIDVAGSQGWLVWENSAATAAATVAMSCELEEGAEQRRLTPLEAGLVGDLLVDLARVICGKLGLGFRPGPLSQSVRGFLAQLENDERADTQRLYVHLALDGPGGPSTLRFYLPGVLPEVEQTGEMPAELPDHLDRLPVDLSAELGRVELDLDDLMKLEVGDVIPLPTVVGERINLCIEGRLAAKATWGNLRGRLALRIEKINEDL